MIDKLGLQICLAVFFFIPLFFIIADNEMQKQYEILKIIDNKQTYTDDLGFCVENDMMVIDGANYICKGDLWWIYHE
jgi:hypothetical protein